jgi:imidazolonepropionase-like amidohydrolase
MRSTYSSKRRSKTACSTGPRIVPCGRWLITTGDSNDLPNFWWWGITSPGSQRICDGPDEFRKAVRQEIKEGAEIVKIFADSGHALLYGSDFVSMTEAELRAVVEAAHDRGKKVRCHVTAKRMILRCIDAGVDVLDHADGMDDECIEAMVKAGTYVCPSLYLPKAMLAMIAAQGQGKQNEPFFVTMRRDLDRMCEVLPRAAKAGVKLMVGDDWGTVMTPHGDYAKELELYVNDAGIDARTVLRWAIVHGTECMGMGEQLGRIEEGRLADVVAVHGDPSRDISILASPDNIRLVMKDGKLIREVLPPAPGASRLRAAR